MLLRFRVSMVACGCAAAMMGLILSSPAGAQSVWNNAGTDWNTPAKWTGRVPGSSGIGQFTSSTYTNQPVVGSAGATAGGIQDTGGGSFTSGARAR